jgi:hypothetical protein
VLFDVAVILNALFAETNDDAVNSVVCCGLTRVLREMVIVDILLKYIIVIYPKGIIKELFVFEQILW